jgi:Heavy metal binding domain
MERKLKMISRNLLTLSMALGLTGSIALADGAAGHEDEQTEQIAEGESHGHESPHGGIVKTAGDYHVELVVKPAGSMMHDDKGDEPAGHGEKAEHDEKPGHDEKPDHGEKAEHENNHDKMADNEVWSCAMDTQVRESAAGKCPICGMNLTVAKDGAAHLEIYILAGADSAGAPIAAEPLSAYLQVPDEEGFRNTTLRPAPLAGEEEGQSSHFVGMIEPKLADTAFTATVRIPIDGETHRVAFQVKPKNSHDEGHESNEKSDEAEGHDNKPTDGEHAEKKDHH